MTDDLPIVWDSVPLELVGMPSTSNVDPSKFPNEIFELYSVPSYANNKPEIVTGAEIRSTKQSVEIGDVLLCKIAPHLNRVWIVRELHNYRRIASSEWIVIRSKIATSDYLRYALTEPKFRSAFMATSSGVGGSLIRARPRAVAKILIPLPPINEQRRIVEKLDRIFDRLRRVRDELSHIKKLIDRYRQSVLTAAFHGDLTADFRADLIQQKTTNDLSMSNNLPISWTIAEIRAVVEKYQTIDPKKFPENSFTYVDIGSIDNRTQVITEPKTFLGKDAPSRARRIIKYEDTLFSTVRTYLKNIALVPKELDGCLTSTGICILRPSDQVNPLYLFNWVRSDQFVKSMSVVMDGTMYPAVNDSDVYSGKIPLPPLEEQKEIVRRIEERFAKIEKIEQEYQKAVKLCDRLEQATLAKAFRGELVPQDPNDEPASVLLERIRAERAMLTQPRKKSPLRK